MNRGYSKSVDFKIFVMKRFLLSILFFVGFVSAVFGQSTGDFQTRQSGNWNDSDTWEEWTGSSWDNTANTPTSADGVISILDTHTVTVTANVSVDQTYILSGGILNINNSVTFSVASGSGDDLTSNAGSTINNSGNISIAPGSGGGFGGTPAATVRIYGLLNNFDEFTNASSSRLYFEDGSTYNHDQDGGVIPTSTWRTNSNCNIIGSDTGIPTSGLSQSYGNFTWDTPLLDNSFFVSLALTSAFEVKNNMEIINTGGNILGLAPI